MSERTASSRKNGLPAVRSVRESTSGAERRLVADERFDHRACLDGAERRERDLPVVRVAHPSRVELGTEVRDDQCPRAGIRLDELLEEGVARGVEPVQVLEDEDEWGASRSAAASRVAPCRRSDAFAPLPTSAAPDAPGPASSMKSKNTGRSSAIDAPSNTRRPAIFSRACLCGVGLGDLEIVAEELQDRLQRHVLAVGEPMSAPHGDAARGTGLCELLARAGSSRRPLRRRRRRPVHCLPAPRERGLEPGDLVFAPDESGQSSRAAPTA